MTKNITRVVVKPCLKNDLPIMKNYLTTTSIKTKRNFQRKYGILSQQITWKIVQRCTPVNRGILFGNSYTSGKKPSK